MERSTPGGRDYRWAFLGRVDYQTAWDLQRALAAVRQEGRMDDTLLLLEHPPTYTLGRRGNDQDLRLPREALSALGAAVYDVDRGGQATFHGPGQLVGYPIIDIRPPGGPLSYVRALERVLIDTLAEYGVRAGRWEGQTGVWVEGEKIAAIGVKVSRGVTTHGFALNVSTDLSWFDHIIPCGMPDARATSLQRRTGRTVALEEAAARLAERFGQAMGFATRPATAQEVWIRPTVPTR